MTHMTPPAPMMMGITCVSDPTGVYSLTMVRPSEGGGSCLAEVVPASASGRLAVTTASATEDPTATNNFVATFLDLPGVSESGATLACPMTYNRTAGTCTLDVANNCWLDSGSMYINIAEMQVAFDNADGTAFHGYVNAEVGASDGDGGVTDACSVNFDTNGTYLPGMMARLTPRARSRTVALLGQAPRATVRAVRQ